MRLGTALFVILPLVLVVGAFVLVATRGAGAGPLQDGVFWDDEVAGFVRRKVALTYVDELDDERGSHAFYRALDAYVQDLDRYSRVIPPEEHRRWRESTAGEYAGLGIKVHTVGQGLEIVGLLPGGPAYNAGLKPGDILTAANGQSLADVEVLEVERLQLLKGKPGSEVTITYLPKDAQPEDDAQPAVYRRVAVRRAVIRPPTVYARQVGERGEFGVIRLAEFAEATEEDFSDALRELIEKEVKAIVLDLRGNGGGVLPTAVGVVNRFVERGVVVRMEGRSSRSNRVYEAEPAKLVSDTLPLVVLVDGESASASEVVAGALQDHRRALLVGERTYGKFLVQQITEIPGHEAALQLTTSRYYLPSGRSYQRATRNGIRRNGPSKEPAGILPDVVVPLDKAAREMLQKARLNEEAVPWGEKPPFPEVPVNHVDPQLKKAMELLEGQIVLRRIRGTPRRK